MQTLSGAFLSTIILRTFSVHLVVTSGIATHAKQKEFPKGALALATVAVSFILLLYTILTYVAG